MLNDSLQVTTGDALQLQFIADHEPARPRLTVSVIGQITGRSLLVSHPSIGGRLVLVRDGEPVACRMFSEGRMLGFKTTVRKVVTPPDAYLHLDYPRELEQRVLRRAPRVAVDLAARVRRTDTARSHVAHVEDISLRGCRLTALRTDLEIDACVELTADVIIGETTHTLCLPGVVRNTLDGGREASVAETQTFGVEFVRMAPSEQLLVRAYLYDRLHGDADQPAATAPRPVAIENPVRTRIPMSA